MLHNPIQFLHEHRPHDTVAQIVVATQSKRACYWLPGNKVRKKPPTYSIVPPVGKLLGVTPGVFYHPATMTQHEQPVYITWAGLDIDDYPTAWVIDAFRPLPEVSLRTSTSGEGIHAFIRFEEPIRLSPGENRNLHIKAAWWPLLQKIGWTWDMICSTGYRAFYVSGGANEWVHQSDLLVPVPKLQTLERISHSYSKDLQDEKDPRLARFLGKVCDLVPIKAGQMPCYIKDIYERLRGTEFEFKTKSPMQSAEPHHNGFIDYRPGERILLFASADGHPVLTLTAKNFWLNKLSAGRYRDSMGGQ